MARPWTLGIDFGTSYTVVVGRLGDESPEVIEADGVRRMPSVVFIDENDHVVVGQFAEQMTAARPESVLRAPKARLGDPAPVVLAGRPRHVPTLVAAVLRRGYDAAVLHFGSAPSSTRLTYPATWGRTRISRLEESARLAGITDPLFVPEPVAAALAYYRRGDLPPGAHVGVYDLGGGTFDTAILQVTDEGFSIVGRPGGDASIGGEMFDELVVQAIGDRLDPAEWEQIQLARDQGWAHARATLYTEARQLKESLSVRPWAEVAIAVPGGVRTVRLEQQDLEVVLEPYIDDTIATFMRCIRDAGLDNDALSAIQLVGGASYMPIVQRMVTEAFPGTPIHRRGDPKASVAIGSVLAPTLTALPADQAARVSPTPTPRRSLDAEPPTPATARIDPEPPPAAMPPAPTPPAPTPPASTPPPPPPAPATQLPTAAPPPPAPATPTVVAVPGEALGATTRVTPEHLEPPPPTTPTPAPTRRTRLFVGIGIGAVVLLALATIGIVLSSSGDDDGDAAGTTAATATTAAPVTTATPASTQTAANEAGPATTAAPATTVGPSETAATPADYAMRVTVDLAPEAVWDDGTPITWADLECTWRANLNTPGSIGTAGYDYITGVSPGTSDKQVLIDFGWVYAPYRALFNPIIQAAAVADCDDVSADFQTELPRSARQYVLESWSLDQSILVPNPSYWGDAPVVNRIVMVPQADTDTELAAIKSGQVDFIYPQFFGGIEEALLDPNVKLAKVRGPDYEGIYFQQLEGPLADPVFRKALALSIDREALFAQIYVPVGGEEVLQCGPIVPGPYCADAFADVVYDPEGAEAALAEAGWTKDGNGMWQDPTGTVPEIRWMINTGNRRRENTQAYLIPLLQAAGFNVIADNCDAACMFQQRLPSLDYDMTMYIGTAFPDPSYLTPAFACDQIPGPENNNQGQNSQGWCDEAATAALYQADVTLDEAARAELIKSALEAMSNPDNILMLPMVQFPKAGAYRIDRLGPAAVVEAELANYRAFGNFGEWQDLDGDGQIVIGAEQWPDCLNPVTECAFSSWMLWTAAFPFWPGVWDTTAEGTFEITDLVTGEPIVEIPNG